MKKLLLAGIALCLLAPLAQADSAVDSGDVFVRAGVAYIDPESKGLDVGGANLAADSAASLAFNIEYMFNSWLGLELLASAPFTHDLELDGAKIGETKHLPPTLSVNFHWPLGNFVPYAGVGVNWTIFFDEQLDTGTDVLALDDSFGLTAQVGLDWLIGDHWLVNANVRYISIETDAIVGGVLASGGAAALGSVDINPWVYGLYAGYKF